MTSTSKLIIGLVLTVIAFNSVECTVANFLADRAVVRMLHWIRDGGYEWLTFPGLKAQGINNSTFYTLALAGPKFYNLVNMNRTHEAHMGDDFVSEALSAYSQNLTFQLALKNLTLKYDHIAYTHDRGLRNESLLLTTDGIVTNLTITITGSGSQCIASAADVDVHFNGNRYIKNPTVFVRNHQIITDKVNYHFDSNMRNAIEVFMFAATVNMFDNYDICSDKSISPYAYMKMKSLHYKMIEMQKLKQ